MLVRSILETSSVNGPGNRTVVWLQGCLLSCPGCFNTETHPLRPTDGSAEYYSPDRLAMKILSYRDRFGTDGVTFSGGEPMHQAYGLAELMQILRTSDPRFSIGMYTGYTERELDEGRYVWKRITRPHKTSFLGQTIEQQRIETWQHIRNSLLDFAVMGRFNQNKLDSSRPLCSSSNQQLRLFNDRYRLEDFRPQEVEFTILDGHTRVTGFPTGAIA